VTLSVRATVDMKPAEALRRGGAKKATRIGLNRASAPVKAAVVSEAQAIKRFGFTAKAVRIRLREYPPDKWVSVVGPSSSFSRTKGKRKRGKRKGQPIKHVPAKYAHLVNKGTKRSKPKPFLVKAHAKSKAGFLRDAKREVGKEIAAELARRSGAAG
jgi:hypothetical protein